MLAEDEYKIDDEDFHYNDPRLDDLPNNEEFFYLKDPKTKLSTGHLNKNMIDWICQKCTLSEEFMMRYHKILNWDILVREQKLSEDFLLRVEDLIDWKVVLTYQEISEEFIFKNDYIFKRIRYKGLMSNRDYSDKFLKRYGKYINWMIHTQHKGKDISLDYIEQYKDKLDWFCIINFNMEGRLTLDFLKKYEKYIDINKLRNQYITKEIYDYFKDKIEPLKKICILYKN